MPRRLPVPRPLVESASLIQHHPVDTQQVCRQPPHPGADGKVAHPRARRARTPVHVEDLQEGDLEPLPLAHQHTPRLVGGLAPGNVRVGDAKDPQFLGVPLDAPPVELAVHSLAQWGEKLARHQPLELDVPLALKGELLLRAAPCPPDTAPLLPLLVGSSAGDVCLEEDSVLPFGGCLPPAPSPFSSPSSRSSSDSESLSPKAATS
eukprot:CAMPEP_0114126090 /NCGR_PEP_ID=MMETSP0043_2-20121206/9643_1 /TAXON_ID=464988 /ORGANISM="Hemiselmis andersenii, Strain CCMP644" /LENGTH=205 /DNA_ID=CAMNT_0001219049 /DNA_START=362 /DNA_END=977 /DNA_ORIENTATION=+